MRYAYYTTADGVSVLEGDTVAQCLAMLKEKYLSFLDEEISLMRADYKEFTDELFGVASDADELMDFIELYLSVADAVRNVKSIAELEQLLQYNIDEDIMIAVLH